MAKRLIVVCVGLAAAAAALLMVQLAYAHSRPVRLDPAPGAVLQSAPSNVTGWFTAELRRDPNWTFLHVADQQGNRVDTGEATISPDRRQMSVSLRSGLGPGRYLVTWRTFDDGDGAIFGDCYTFFVGQEAADAAVAQNIRLDGGRDCQRIDVNATEGTPVPGATPQATAGTEDNDESGPASTGNGDNGGVPAWGVVLGAAAGLVVGGLGGRFLGRR